MVPTMQGNEIKQNVKTNKQIKNENTNQKNNKQIKQQQNVSTCYKQIKKNITKTINIHIYIYIYDQNIINNINILDSKYLH